ncbi:MAG: DUF218 domain-containing protein [Blastochloris sp.]|nr:DUF218 domain-containing protein [Chloroflexaceae bacterium]NJO82529.1 DUF218 domain-containing protein [Blastochloris sp.]
MERPYYTIHTLPHRRPWRWRRWLFWLLIGGVLLAGMLIGYVSQHSASRRYNHVAAVPTQHVAVVFGAGVRRDGRPSRILADRVQAAVELYRAGKVEKLLFTGDNSSADYNEVAAMQEYAIEQGIPADAITLDYAGFSTYESCYRARAIFGIKQQAILVTQHYHLPRAVYTCRALGIDAVGLGSADWGRIPPGGMVRYTLREYIATLNALLQVHITRPLPTFLGNFEGLN